MGWRAVVSLAMAVWMSAAVAADSAPLSAQRLAERVQSGDAPALILDTRTPEEFAAGHVPGARLVPHDAIAAALEELAPYRKREIVLYCRSGRRSGLAETELRAHGFTNLTQLEGSWLAWQAAQLPVESGASDAPEAQP